MTHTYQPGTAINYPVASVPPTVIVAAGDTFDSIAQRIYGDASYAESLATYNNRSMDVPLGLGYQLRTPAFLPVHNNADTYIPSQAILSALMGNFYPYFQPKKQDNNLLKELVVVAVGTAVAITAFVLGAAALGVEVAKLTVAQALALGAASAVVGTVAAIGTSAGLGMGGRLTIEELVIALHNFMKKLEITHQMLMSV